MKNLDESVLNPIIKIQEINDSLFNNRHISPSDANFLKEVGRNTLNKATMKEEILRNFKESLNRYMAEWERIFDESKPWVPDQDFYNQLDAMAMNSNPSDETYITLEERLLDISSPEFLRQT
jgi:hypothetical protein